MSTLLDWVGPISADREFLKVVARSPSRGAEWLFGEFAS